MTKQNDKETCENSSNSETEERAFAAFVYDVDEIVLEIAVALTRGIK